MARKKKTVADAGEPSVTRVEVGSRRLVTFAEEHSFWKAKGNLLAVGSKEHFDGAIVRLRPPPGFDEERLEKLKKALADAGAARIKTEVRRKAIVPTEAVEKAKAASRSSARDVVLQVGGEANSADKPALMKLLEATLSEEGL